MIKVMIVEDTKSLLEGIAFDLEMRGFQVTTAADGAIALDLLENMNSSALPDVIVSDIAMPHLNGYQLFEQVQANEAWQSIPFIFLTALASERDIQYGKKLGADDYLVKPFKPEELAIAIENKQRRFAQLKMNAERKLDVVRGQLMSMISHELRTPLTAIYGGAELLSDDFAIDENEVSKQALKLIRSGARRLNRLVNEVLWLVQFNSGHLQQTLALMGQPHSLNEVINLAQQTLSQEMSIERLRFYTEATLDHLKIKGLREVLVMILVEAFHNALRFSPADSLVEVTTRVSEDTVFMEITDHGVGIASEDIEKVWLPFSQSNRQIQEQQGIGLGLTLVQEGIRLHGGEATLYSEPDAGTTLVLQFPLFIESN
jgi:two-component system, sensor histidine kinase and response regulator